MAALRSQPLGLADGGTQRLIELALLAVQISRPYHFVMKPPSNGIS